jgi:hypothetical protein
MSEGLFGCFDDIPSCLCSTFCINVMHGYNMGKIGSSCLCHCLFYCCCAGCDENKIQDTLVGSNDGVVLNCLKHICCGCCMVSRSARALQAWELAGKPSSSNAVVM